MSLPFPSLPTPSNPRPAIVPVIPARGRIDPALDWILSELTRGGIVRAGQNAIDWDRASIAGIPIEVLIFVLFTALVGLVSFIN